VTRLAAKQKTAFACTECGQSSPKLLGQCPACRKWNTLQEELVVPEVKGATPRGWGPAGGARPMPLREIEGNEEARVRTGITELDRVLGGGVVPGSLILLGGDPGCWRSRGSAEF